jgi:hypothetical protein
MILSYGKAILDRLSVRTATVVNTETVGWGVTSIDVPPST